MGAGHDHHHGSVTNAAHHHRGRLWAAFGLLAALMVVEAVAAFAHRLAGPALRRRAHVHRRARHRHGPGRDHRRPGAPTGDPQRTFGLYRLEVLAALANAVLLSGVAIYVVVEAIRRFGDPPEVRAGPMLAVAALGLLANLVAFALLRGRGARESINLRRAPTWRCSATCSARSA